MDGLGLAPEREQRPNPFRQLLAEQAPRRLVDHGARPGTQGRDPASARRISFSLGLSVIAPTYPRRLATCWNQATSGGRQIDAGQQHQGEVREHRQV